MIGSRENQIHIPPSPLPLDTKKKNFFFFAAVWGWDKGRGREMTHSVGPYNGHETQNKAHLDTSGRRAVPGQGGGGGISTHIPDKRKRHLQRPSCLQPTTTRPVGAGDSRPVPQHVGPPPPNRNKKKYPPSAHPPPDVHKNPRTTSPLITYRSMVLFFLGLIGIWLCFIFVGAEYL